MEQDKRTLNPRILKILIAGAVVLCILLLCPSFFGGNQNTLYLPETVEVIMDGVQINTDVYDYDSNGHLSKIRSRNIRGEETVTQVTCDKNGNIIQLSTDIFLRGEFMHTQIIKYTYSTQGNLLTTTASKNNTEFDRTQWDYDVTNRITRCTQTVTSSAGKTSVTQTMYEYDQDGKLVTSTMYIGDDLRATTAFTYNAEGKLLREERRNHRDTVISWVDYTYEQDNTVASVHKIAGETTNVTTYTYDHVGNLIRQGYSDGKTVMEYRYQYKEQRVAANAPRRSFTMYDSLPQNGLLDSLG